MKSSIPLVAVLAFTLGLACGAVPFAHAEDWDGVLRLECQNKRGTAFLHKSGRVISAAHVVAGCNADEITLSANSGQSSTVREVIVDEARDLALLTTAATFTAVALPVSSEPTLQLGSQVITYGFPEGYGGRRPLLTVGYLAGDDLVTSGQGPPQQRWVVNAAFNRGNSGGPLIVGGTVIGVVSSKLAPLPHDVEIALDALRNRSANPTFTRRRGETTERLTEAQVVAEVLDHLRAQTQLVIGHAVKLGDVRSFLEAHDIDP